MGIEHHHMSTKVFILLIRRQTDSENWETKQNVMNYIFGSPFSILLWNVFLFIAELLYSVNGNVMLNPETIEMEESVSVHARLTEWDVQRNK